MRVVVIGAGIGGLALALALARRGVRTLVLERAESLEAVGAGVQLGPNATRILFAWGLEPPLRVVSATPDAAEVASGATGRRLLRIPLGAAAERRWGGAYLQLHRADLQAVLLDAARAETAITLRLGAPVRTVSDRRVVLEDGEAIDAEVIVGADGVRSGVRVQALGGPAPQVLGETAWRALVPAQGDPQTARVWTFPRRHLVAYPVRGGAVLNLVAITSGGADGAAWSEPAAPAALRAAFVDAAPPVRALLQRVETTTRWSLTRTPPLARWGEGSITLLGDAAHATAPYLAQGAAMAIEDAEALARHLAGATGGVPDRLRAYEAERRPRTARVQAASQRNGVVFHQADAVARLGFGGAALADRLLGRDPAARLDWLYGYRPPV